MKKYHDSGVKIFSILTLVCLLMIVVGAVMLLLASNQLDWILLLLGFGVFLGIVFLALLLTSIKNYILLDNEKIIFPITRAPKLHLKRNTIKFSEVKCVKVITYKGDGIISKDTTMYRFIMRNGLEFSETFYSYGKKSELEIVAHLKNHIHFSG